MSNKELNRLNILQDLKNRRINTSQAAESMMVSLRHAYRLKNSLIKEGPEGLVSKKVGARSNHQMDKSQMELVLAFFKKPEHSDFGPTLAYEYLVEGSGLKISLSSVRSIMIRHGIWTPNRPKQVKIHPLRQRKARKGELIQLDGSEHDWFEGRGPRCSLLVYVDDATSELMHLKFVKSENLWDYFEATKEYLRMHGRPEAFYPDKHAVFRVNREGSLKSKGLTQFGRAMQELDIKLICANSPQAKGRVERKNRDLQDRLVKALRVAGINDMETANTFLPAFLLKFNKRFSKTPAQPTNAHKPILSTHNLDRIFCIKDTRNLSKNLTLQYENVVYQVLAENKEYTLRHATIDVLQLRDGSIRVERQGKRLVVRPYDTIEAKTEVVSSKELLEKLKEPKIYKPSKKHPWKRGSKKLKREMLV